MSEEPIIRAVDYRRDLAGVSRLVLKCFHPWMDTDSDSMTRRLIEEGEWMRSHPVLSRFTTTSHVMEGVVCAEESGRVIGNVNVFPAYTPEGMGWLIANVAVDPAFQRQGLARRMMERVIRNARERGVSYLYLEARETSPNVVAFYRSMGFFLMARRTQWIAPKGQAREERDFIMGGTPSFRGIKPAKQSLKRAYPDAIRWNLGNPLPWMLPGTLGRFWNRLLNPHGEFLQYGGQSGTDVPVGWTVFQSRNDFANRLWILPNGETPDERMVPMLRGARIRYCGEKALMTDVPAVFPEQLFRDAGFFLNERICWMKTRVR